MADFFPDQMTEVLSFASQLGVKIGATPAVKNFRELSRQLELDLTARTLLEQFEQLMETLAMKEANGQPIEISDKQKIESLQSSMAIHPLLKKIAAAQAEYTDLMKKIQESINAGLMGKPLQSASPASKLII